MTVKSKTIDGSLTMDQYREFFTFLSFSVFLSFFLSFIILSKEWYTLSFYLFFFFISIIVFSSFFSDYTDLDLYYYYYYFFFLFNPRMWDARGKQADWYLPFLLDIILLSVSSYIYPFDQKHFFNWLTSTGNTCFCWALDFVRRCYRWANLVAIHWLGSRLLASEALPLLPTLVD